MSRRLKRCLDVCAAIVGFVVGAPVFLIASGAVFVFDGRPIIFRQVRAGFRGRPFTIAKFRTMRNTRDRRGDLISDAERLTRAGRFLRSTSLDELPQLWNVLKGEMSLVGPRPLLMEYLPLYTPQQARRHDVKPGLTTWNAVNGRNSMSWDQQLEMDVWYVDHWSLGLDLRIVGLTVLKVLQRDGVTQEGHVTRAKFCGSTPLGDGAAADAADPSGRAGHASDGAQGTEVPPRSEVRS